jgi:hypothetical protein
MTTMGVCCSMEPMNGVVTVTPQRLSARLSINKLTDRLLSLPDYTCDRLNFLLPN